MEEKTKLRILFVITISYMIFFMFASIFKTNYEFLYYTGIMVVFLFIISKYHKSLQMSSTLIAALSVFGMLHVMGGNLNIGAIRLYDLWLIPGVFKYDNLMHMVLLFLSTIFAYNLLYPHLDKKLEHSKILLSLLLILIASGFGAFIEIFELIGVLFFGSGPAVGNYLNNAFDLVFNLLGSILACVVLIRYHITLGLKKIM